MEMVYLKGHGYYQSTCKTIAAMNVSEALFKRHATRAFLKKAVAVDKISRILDRAGHAPSGANTQPWQVAVVMGEKKKQLQQRLEYAFRNGKKRQMNYCYYPNEWCEPYKTRRKACGLQLYSALAISREDKDRRTEQWIANYRAFDAPVMLLFFMDSVMQTGSFLDYGMFLQSIMLLAVEEGLATCPQAALAEYPDIVKEELDFPDDVVVICGMAMGYEDPRHRINSYRTPRLQASAFSRFFS